MSSVVGGCRWAANPSPAPRLLSLDSALARPASSSGALPSGSDCIELPRVTPAPEVVLARSEAGLASPAWSSRCFPSGWRPALLLMTTMCSAVAFWCLSPRGEGVLGSFYRLLSSIVRVRAEFHKSRLA